MTEVELIQAISSIASSVSTVGVLIWWIVLERKRSDVLLQLLSNDWQRQRDEEIDKQVENRLAKKLGAGGI
jgi:hypothetical protein